MKPSPWRRKVAAATLAGTVLAVGGSFAPALAASPPPALNVSTPAASLRYSLDQLLGAHAVLAILTLDALYKGSAWAPDLAAQLNTNTQELSAAIASVYGSAAGQAFQTMWAGHITDFVHYEAAVKSHNAAGKQAALNALATYEQQFAAFMAKADPYMNATTLASSLQVHVQQIIQAFTAYTQNDPTAFAADLTAAYNHMFMDGQYFAQAIVQQFPAKFGHTSPNTPAANLTATLDQLLGAHAWLAVTTLDGLYSGSANATALAGQLAANTQSLSGAIASVYGSAAGQTFQTMWAGHITDFVHYDTALKAHNTSGEQAAQNALATYEQQFAAFMAKANPNLSATTLASSLQVHVTQIIQALQAYAGGHPTRAANDLVVAYNHMFMDGSYLGQAIVTQFPSKFSPTMTGATSPVTGLPLAPIAGVGVAALLAGAYLLRPKKAQASRP